MARPPALSPGVDGRPELGHRAGAPGVWPGEVRRPKHRALQTAPAEGNWGGEAANCSLGWGCARLNVGWGQMIQEDAGGTGSGHMLVTRGLPRAGRPTTTRQEGGKL